MKDRIVLQIITPREDGCIVNVTDNGDGTLNVVLISCHDKVSVVDKDERLPKADLFEWIDNHQDW